MTRQPVRSDPTRDPHGTDGTRKCARHFARFSGPTAAARFTFAGLLSAISKWVCRAPSCAAEAALLSGDAGRGRSLHPFDTSDARLVAACVRRGAELWPLAHPVKGAQLRPKRQDRANRIIRPFAGRLAVLH